MMVDDSIMIKDRIIGYIRRMIIDVHNMKGINTNEGVIVDFKIYHNDVFALLNGNDVNIRDFKLTTLYQIIGNLKCIIIYDDLVEEIKSKDNHWDKKKRKWTHKPINEEELMNKARSFLRNGRDKKVVRRKNLKNI